MGDPRERNYQSLFSELAGYEKKGVYMLMNGVPASPMQIVQAHIVREDAVYMRDYVLNDNGDIKELCFDDVEMQKQAGISGGSHLPADIASGRAHIVRWTMVLRRPKRSVDLQRCAVEVCHAIA